MQFRFAFIFALGTLVAGCASPGEENFLHNAEKVLKTDTALYQKLHRVAHYQTGLTFNFHGYLIGVEKSPRELVTRPREIQDLFKPLPAGHSIEGSAAGEIQRLLKEEKAVYPTHIVRYGRGNPEALPERIVPCFTYLAYGSPKEIKMCKDGVNRPSNDSKEWPHGAWGSGIQAIRDLRSYIAKDIEDAKDSKKSGQSPARPFTHILVYVMGWNTAQDEAVRNFNSLVGELMSAVPESDRQKFHPLVIGISWPSLWDWSDRPILSGFDFLVKLFSYTTKANDADEVGLVPLNVLLHQVLGPITRQFARDNLKIVLIGHSFGARVASRGAYSGDILNGVDSPGGSTGTVDLFVGLQGAFSINRFIAGKGREGSPYQEYSKVNRVVLTASIADEAVRTSFWADTAGDFETYVEICKEYPNTFDCRKVNQDGQWISPPSQATGGIVYVDASELIRNNASGTGGGAHSDIYRPQMGQFVWRLISEIP